MLIGDLKITIGIVCITVFTSTTSLFPSGENDDANNVFAQDTNSSVLVENRAISLEDLLCNDGSHPEAEGICDDGSHPLVIRTNPVPIIEEFVNETYPATMNIELVSVCSDHTIANSNTSKCRDGSLPNGSLTGGNMINSTDSNITSTNPTGSNIPCVAGKPCM